MRFRAMGQVGAVVSVGVAMAGCHPPASVEQGPVEGFTIEYVDPYPPICPGTPKLTDRHFLFRAADKYFINQRFGDTPHIEPEVVVTDGACDAPEIKLHIRPEMMKPLAKNVTQTVLDAVVKIQVTDQAGQNRQGSGFLLAGKNSSPARLVTAGHVIPQAGGEAIAITRANGKSVKVQKLASYLVGDIAQPSSEDIAFAQINNTQQGALDKVALTSRDRRTDPIKYGEQFYFINFQGHRTVDRPAIYSMLFLRDPAKIKNSRTIELTGNVDPDKKEDELKGGGSGGVVVDSQGRAMGVAIARYYNNYRCAPSGQLSVPGREVGRMWVRPRLDTSRTDECNTGLQRALVRVIDEDGAFGTTKVKPVVLKVRY